MDAKLPLIGHERVLVEKLAKQVYNFKLPDGTLVTPLRQTSDRRGFAFEVNIPDPDGEPTGRIARIEIKLDRVE